MSVKIYKKNQLISENPTVANLVVAADGGDCDLLEILDGGQAVNTVVSSGGSVTVAEGGSAAYMTVESGGYIFIEFGGKLNELSIKRGGSLGGFVFEEEKYWITVHQNVATVAHRVTVEGNKMVVAREGIAEHTTMSDAVMNVEAGGSAVDTTVKEKGVMNVYAEADAFDVTVDINGLLNVEGTAADVTVLRGGNVYVDTIGTVDGIVVKEGANITVDGTVYDLNLQKGGIINGYSFSEGLYWSTVAPGKVIVDYGVEIIKDKSGNWYNFIIGNGGNAQGVTVHNGQIHVLDGGVVSNATVKSNNEIFVYGTADATLLEQQAYMFVSGGLAKNTNAVQDSVITVKGGGRAFNTMLNKAEMIVADGTAEKTFVNGGFLQVEANNTVSESEVYANGSMVVKAGASANIVEVRNGGKLEVNGFVENTTVKNGGSAFIMRRASAENTVVDNGGSMRVSNGAAANDTVVNSGGVINVAFGANLNDLTVAQGGDINGFVFNEDLKCDTVQNGIININDAVNIEADRMDVNADGKVEKLTVTSGNLYVFSGGEAVETELNNVLRVFNGGKATGTKVNDKAKLFVSGAAATETTEVINGVAADTIVNSGGIVHVKEAGLVNAANVHKGGTMNVSSGGTATAVSFDSGASLKIEDGGIADNVSLSDGALFDITLGKTTYAAGTANGSAFKMENGMVDSFTVTDGSVLNVEKDAVAENTVVNANGNLYAVSGTVNRTVVNENGFLHVLTDGFANETVVKKDGNMHVAGKVSETLVEGGKMFVSAGGSAAETTVTDNATMRVFEHGFAESATVQNGGEIIVYNDGRVMASVVAYGGSMHVSSGGSVLDNRVDVGGSMHIFDDGDAEVVENGGYVKYDKNAKVQFVANTFTGAVIDGTSATVHSSTVAEQAVISNKGKMYVYSDGLANGTVVNADGELVVYGRGSAHQTTVNANGLLSVNGGKVTESVVENSGLLNVAANGTADSSFVKENGKISVKAGGSALNTTIRNGGLLELLDGSFHTGTMTIDDGGAVIAEDEAEINFSIVGRTESDDYIINNLSLVEGTPVYSVTVDVNQAYGTYKLADKAAHVDSWQFEINKGLSSGTFTVNGTYWFDITDDTFYILQMIDDSLTLTITDKWDGPAKPIWSKSTEEWTNQDVVVTAIYPEEAISKRYSFDGSVWYDYTEEITFEANGTVYFKYQVATGNWSEIAECVVDHIDKDAPVITISGNADGPVNSDVVLTASANEDQCKFRYSFDMVNWFDGSVVIVKDNNTTVYFEATDKAGNVTSKFVNVDQIDKTPPAAPLASGAMDSESGVLNVSAVFAEDSVKNEYSLNGGYVWQEYDGSIEVDRNCDILFRSTDAAGNASDFTSFKVNDFTDLPPDTEAPDLIVYGNTTEITTENVVLQVFSSDEFATVWYSLDNVRWEKMLSYSDGLIIEENMTVYFKAVDPAGNSSDVKVVEIKNIDKGYQEPPVEKHEYFSSKVNITAANNLEEYSKIASFKPVEKITNSKKYSKYSTVANAKGTLNISGKDTGDIVFEYYSKVNIKDGAEVASVIGGKYSEIITVNKDGRTEKITSNASGSIKVIDSIVGEIVNFNSVTLENSQADIIANIAGASLEVFDPDAIIPEPIIPGFYETKLVGTLNLKADSSAANVRGFKTVNITDSFIGEAENINKISVKGNSEIVWYFGSKNNDTLTVNKNAVLVLGGADFGDGKDKFVNNGSVIFSNVCDIIAEKLSGKGDFAATSDIWTAMSSKVDNLLNLGQTYGGFRNAKYELADNTQKKAVKWDMKSDLNGWLNNDIGFEDTVDFIKFKAKESGIIKISGELFGSADKVTLNGLELSVNSEGDYVASVSAKTDYILKLERNEENSMQYSISLIA